MSKKKVKNKSIYKGDDIYINRKLAWIDFNYRILHEAGRVDTPLLERLNFLAITQTNQDEFVSVRVAGLKDQVHEHDMSRDIAGMTASEQLNKISLKLHGFVKDQYAKYDELLDNLRDENIYILNYTDLNVEQIDFVYKYFKYTLYPILTPMAVDSGRPFPLIKTETKNIAVLLKSKKEPDEPLRFATIQVPEGINRLLKLPLDDFCEENNLDPKTTHCYVLLEDIINAYLDELFIGQTIVARCHYRIIRNADMDINDTTTRDLLSEVETQVKQRQWGEVIRLEVRDDVSLKILSMLKDYTEVAEDDIYHIPGPLDLGFLSNLSDADELDYREDLHYPPYEPQLPFDLVNENRADIFSVIRKKDVFLSLPYESFDAVTEFVKQAARDPKVLAIKQTLYRVSSNSPIIHYLEEAVDNGKQVFVLLELKARFDESNNIEWAKRLEQAGAHVIYGLKGVKTHSKITMVVREEEDGIRRYVHLATGNYNDKTAKGYTDVGIFTSADVFGSDATEFFNMLSGYSEPAGFQRLMVAPNWLRQSFYDLIDREIVNAKAGKEARIIAKMNQLEDKGVIDKLYEASQAGVKIDLIVRGLNCLRSGVKGLSENIMVKSIVGRYLEHSRIFVFYNNGDPEYYSGSADWMTRNLDRRVEVVFPVEDVACQKRLREILSLQLKDTERSYVQQADSSYLKIKADSEDEKLDCMKAQEQLALERAALEEEQENERMEPAYNEDIYTDDSVYTYDSRLDKNEKMSREEFDD